MIVYKHTNNEPEYDKRKFNHIYNNNHFIQRSRKKVRRSIFVIFIFYKSQPIVTKFGRQYP